MHLLQVSTSGIVESTNSLRGPAMTFRQQGHLREYGHSRRRKLDTHLGVAVLPKAPLESGADVIETGKVRCSIRGGPQSRRFGRSVLQPAPVVRRVKHPQIP